MRNYSFRLLTEADLPLMRRWLMAAHVREWWPDADRQVALMQQDMNNPKINMRIVSLGAHAFAYLHDHDKNSFGMPQYTDLPQGARVMSTFTGDPDFIGQGHAVGYIDAHVRALRQRYPQVAVGPNTTDTRGISIFRRAGFMNRRLASTRDGRLVQVMTHN